ncbi:MAG: hypothetical protein ACRD16_08750 [Thermoanaerobaculia bacterium]
MNSAIKNFHLPLPAPTYAELREQAEREGRPATSVAREAIESWLALRRKMELHEEIAVYAEAMRGTPADLDRSLERAAARRLRKTARGRKP